MAEEGTFCINADVVKKAGANVSATSIAEAFTNNYIQQAEGRIMDEVRTDLKSGYTGINSETKELLKEASSNLAAIYAIQFDMSGFTSRLEAEDMISILTFNFREAMKILRDQKTITYSQVANGEVLGITVREVDTDPTVTNVDTMVFPNGTLTDDGNGQVTITVSGTGDVVGPAGAVDNRICTFDGATGKLIQDSGVLVSSFMQDVIDDTTPQLGGNLDIQAFNIETAVAADFVKLAALTATSTELNYVDGVTSAIQTQINTKAPSASPTLTGTTDVEDLDISQHAYFVGEVNNGDSGATDTIDWTTGNKQRSTLTDDVTYTFSAPTGPCNILLRLIQDGTGSRLATWPATVKWPGGTAPTLSTAASSVDIVSFYYDGTNYYGVGSLDFS